MNSQTEFPRFVLEMKRYDVPEEIWNFFMFKAESDVEDKAELEMAMAHITNRHPSQGPITYTYWEFPFGDDEGKTGYAEIARASTKRPVAQQTRQFLANSGFIPMSMEEITEQFRDWVIHYQCPIEWQKSMEAGQPDVLDRVKVWVMS